MSLQATGDKALSFSDQLLRPSPADLPIVNDQSRNLFCAGCQQEIPFRWVLVVIVGENESSRQWMVGVFGLRTFHGDGV